MVDNFKRMLSSGGLRVINCFFLVNSFHLEVN